ncbi:MAG TPA: glycosyltransferase family 9 protein [Solirubrobacterales bacterium]|nr:glycosyltransferase family 9 protein [Solirubrobacterales bacterium]
MTGGVLAVRQDSLGDVLLAGPALRAISAGADGPLTLLCGPRGEAAARLLPGVDDVIVHLAPWIDPEPPPIRVEECQVLIDEVRRRAPRQAVIFTSFHQSPLPTALLLRLAGVSCIVAIPVDYPGSLLDVRHRVDDEIHEVERALSLAEAAGYPLPDDDDGRLAVKLEAGAPELPAEPFVVLHPGASVSARAWEPRRWVELAALLAAEGRRLVVTGAPAERQLTATVTAAAPGALDLGGRCDFSSLAAVLARAEAVVVANTGPAHLAAAVGTPVVSLYAPTVPAVRWRPWGVPHELLYRDVPCAGCRATTCPVPGHPCLHEVEATQAAAALGRLAGKPTSLEAVA